MGDIRDAPLPYDRIAVEYDGMLDPEIIRRRLDLPASGAATGREIEEAIARDDLVVAADGSGNYTSIQAAIDELPEELHTAIVLRELDGLSYEEIAAAMECPIGTVRSRIFRARDAIDRRIRPLLD